MPSHVKDFSKRLRLRLFFRLSRKAWNRRSSAAAPPPLPHFISAAITLGDGLTKASGEPDKARLLCNH